MQDKLIEKFFRYVAVSSQSDGSAGIVPSSEGQRELAVLLQKELRNMGLVDVEVSDKAVLTAKLPANLPEGFQGSVPAVGLVAHLDTVNMSLSPQIKPWIVKAYDGKDICLNKEKDIWLRTDSHPEVLAYVGQDIIVTDGTSVLGADNKAAISAIMVAFECMIANKAEKYHGDLYIAFVPDEEIGLKGAKSLDLSKFPVDFAYTIDSCEIGEVVYETFNAGSAVIHVKGVTAHPMSSKGVLVNPMLVVNDIVNHFDKIDTPEHTDGTDGYFWMKNMQGNPSKAMLQIDIRDHDKKKYEARKKFILDLIATIKSAHPKAVIDCKIEDMYGNIADAINEDNKNCINYIYDAMKALGVTPKNMAMRGGTDGSYISSQGILTPNFFTGGHNFHSNCEFLPVGSFEKSCEMVLKMIDLVYKDSKK